jgi:hypothetical protein
MRAWRKCTRTCSLNKRIVICPALGRRLLRAAQCDGSKRQAQKIRTERGKHSEGLSSSEQGSDRQEISQPPGFLGH